MVNELLEARIIKKSRSPFSSPIEIVKKKVSSWRMCVHYRQFHKQTIKDKFPIPIVEEFIDMFHGATLFTKLDLRSWKFALVFLDDILSYSYSLEDRVVRLRTILEVVRQ
uniref:Putative mitochondrial protein n=1 Tax=Tanacetum cinerariifolium TaxID=118510 RepID=A0A699TCI1_TANCI|nr:putative mitochondrial protein [Tanacetum cinerariifolium]